MTARCCRFQSKRSIGFSVRNSVKSRRVRFSLCCRRYTPRRTRACRTSSRETRTFQQEFTRFDFIDGNTYSQSKTIEMNIPFTAMVVHSSTLPFSSLLIHKFFFRWNKIGIYGPELSMIRIKLFGHGFSMSFYI